MMTIMATEQQAGHHDEAVEKPLTVLLYASDRARRDQVRLALGRRIAADLPEIKVLEVATQPAVLTQLDAGGIDVVILDGEAVPGGMGLCRQIKHEVLDAPPVLLLAARPDDAWLATWALADSIVPYPVDPVRLPTALADLVRRSSGAVASPS
jgi:DNA-binding response OmpR family regulator